MGTATLIQRISRDAPPPLRLRVLCCLLQADERVLRSRTTRLSRRRTWLSQMWCDLVAVLRTRWFAHCSSTQLSCQRLPWLRCNCAGLLRHWPVPRGLETGQANGRQIRAMRAAQPAWPRHSGSVPNHSRPPLARPIWEVAMFCVPLRAPDALRHGGPLLSKAAWTRHRPGH